MNRQQFIQYVESNQRAVRRFLIALCNGDAALADDLAQDTFVKAYLSCDNFREDSKFLTWIFKIAYNTYINSKRSYKFTEQLDTATAIASTETTDNRFEYQNLYLALEKLSEKEKMSVLLHYMQGYTIAEIAEITESTPEAIKQQLFRGRQNLKNLLKED